MTLLVVNGYAAAVVGRLKNIPVTFVAAIVIGLLEVYIIYYGLVHLSQGLDTDIQMALPMIFLFGALVMLPSVRLRAVGRLSTVRVPRIPGGKESLIAGGGVPGRRHRLLGRWWGTGGHPGHQPARPGRRGSWRSGWWACPWCC